MKHILITGGSGFIGRNLCNHFINNSKITVLDNNISSGKENIIDFIDKDNFNFVQDNLLNINKINIGKIDFIYNLACPASPVWYQKYPNQTIKTCTEGIYELIDFAKKNDSKIFHASTSEVYGDPLIPVQDENYFGNVNSFGPRSCYDEGKRCAEAIFYSNKNEIKYYIGRIFNTYGPYMAKDDGRVVSNFINQAINNEDITIYGKGSQTRSFCYIDDMVNFLKILPDSNSEIDVPFNIGNNKEMTILELAQLIINISNSKSKIIFLDFPENDPKVRRPKLNRIKNEFNWEAEVDLKEGLEKTIQYFKGL